MAVQAEGAAKAHRDDGSSCSDGYDTPVEASPCYDCLMYIRPICKFLTKRSKVCALLVPFSI